MEWTQSVQNGDNSSPAVTATGVYVSYACEQTYAFDPAAGDLIWHHSTSCAGGGGRTPVFAGDNQLTSAPIVVNGYVYVGSALGAGEGLVVVPASNLLVAYGLR